MKVVALIGPTASGKSEMALTLARQWPLEIVNLDSLLVYRYMDIGTAKPKAEIRDEIPHHLIDIVNPDYGFSAADYAARASQIVSEIYQRGHVPLLVGGCGFYLKALEFGVDPAPSGSAEVRRQLQEEEESHGRRYLYERLKGIDRERAEQIHPHDSYRIYRALEIYEMTGRKPSEFSAQTKPKKISIRKIGISMPREMLLERISQRTTQMWRSGLADEVSHLRSMGYHAGLKPLQSVGYAETMAYLNNELDEQQCLSQICLKTWRLAKRQMTWFRRWKEISWGSFDKIPELFFKSFEDFVKVQ